MFDSNLVLGIKSNLQCDGAYRHGILTHDEGPWPCGVPIVYPDVDLEKHKRNIIRVGTLITPSQISAGGKTSMQTHASTIKPVSLRPLYGNHKVMEINRFDINKFDRLTEFIHDVGAISFVIEYKEERKLLSGDLQKLQNKFKYNSLFFWSSWYRGDSYLEGEDDKYVAVLTFLDIPYCVPLFNMRKVDGIGLSLSGATVRESERRGALKNLFKADFIYSNYEENVFTVDGVSINGSNLHGRSFYDDLEKLICLNLPCKMSLPKKLTGTPKKLSKENYSKWQEYKTEYNDSYAKTEIAERASQILKKGFDTSWAPPFEPPPSQPSFEPLTLSAEAIISDSEDEDVEVATNSEEEPMSEGGFLATFPPINEELLTESDLPVPVHVSVPEPNTVVNITYDNDPAVNYAYYTTTNEWATTSNSTALDNDTDSDNEE